MANVLIKLSRGVLIDGRHRDPSEPPFEVPSGLAGTLVACGKAVVVEAPADEPSPSLEPITQEVPSSESGNDTDASDGAPLALDQVDDLVSEEDDDPDRYEDDLEPVPQMPDPVSSAEEAPVTERKRRGRK